MHAPGTPGAHAGHNAPGGLKVPTARPPRTGPCRDRVAGLNVGAHLFAQEVRAGMAERETELRERLGLSLLDGPLQLEQADRTPHTLEGTP